MMCNSTNNALFVFGSLMDSDVLRIVAGVAPEQLKIRQAIAPGFRQQEVVEECYPVLVEDSDSTAFGLIIDSLTAQAMARIHFFEGDEYTLENIEIRTTDSETVAARFFSHTGAYSVKDSTWDFQKWLVEQKHEFVERTQDYMKLFGTMNATEADNYW